MNGFYQEAERLGGILARAMVENVPNFRSESLLEIVAYLEQRLRAGAASVALQVLDPDRGAGRYAGERIALADVDYTHRSFRVWVELADRLGLRLATPRPAPPPWIELRFERLNAGARWQDEDKDADPTEKYGPSSGFARISKLEDPGFVLDFAEALERTRVGPRPRILDLGVNTGDEWHLLATAMPRWRHEAHFVGVDHSATAIEVARQRFPEPNVEFVTADLANLGALALGRFDLIVSIGTLQSPGIDDRTLLRQLVQQQLTPNGALILGFPNCRYLDGETRYGARMKNFRQPELGLLVKDLAFYRKYLQQHRRQVFITGKNYIFLTAVKTTA